MEEQLSPLGFILTSDIYSRKTQNKLLRHCSLPALAATVFVISATLLSLFWFILPLPEFILESFKER
jgi:hypothetical protein